MAPNVGLEALKITYGMVLKLVSMRFEPTTNVLGISDLGKFCKGIFLDLEIFLKISSSRALLACVVQEPMALGRNYWCSLMAKDFNFVSGPENFFHI